VPILAKPGRDDVAVVIPVYHTAYLAEALESVFAQVRPPREVIVVDDGAPDRAAIVRAQNRWPGGFRLVSQPNAGAGAARNQGILATDAEFIAFLDADDRWDPEYLATQMRALASRPECDVAYADALYFGDTPLAGSRFMDVCPSRGPVTPLSLLRLECHIPLSATVARRRALLDAGMFNAAMRRGQDFDMWLRLALSGVKFACNPTVLMHHRIHENNLSGSVTARLERSVSVFTSALADLPLDDAQRAAATRQLRRFEAELAVERGKALLASGDFTAARRALSDARGVAGWKVMAALIGLHVAPQLTRKLYLSRA
jgi:glycosyltransferase involved in cell wall biosynthesis